MAKRTWIGIFSGAIVVAGLGVATALGSFGDLDARCQIYPKLGVGRCAFTNLGTLPSKACVRAWVSTKNGMVASMPICSGVIGGADSKSVEVVFRGPLECGGQPEFDDCTFTIHPYRRGEEL